MARRVAMAMHTSFGPTGFARTRVQAIMPAAMPNDVQPILMELRSMVHRLAGRRLPPERKLAEMLGVGRGSVRRALAQLQEEGLIGRRQGSGTFAGEAGSRELATVGILVDERLRLGDDPFFTRVLETLQKVLQEQAIRCLVHRLESSGHCAILEDAVVTLGLAGDALIQRLTAADPPAVGLFLNRRLDPAGRVSLLDLDDDDAGAQAASHLLAAGCTQILFAGVNELPVSQRRLAGVRRVAPAVSVLPLGMNHAGGVVAADEIAGHLREGALGVIAANDWLALGIHTGLLGLGRSVRQRIHLVSFDGLPMVRESSLGIASLEAPIEGMALDVAAELRRLCVSPDTRGRRIVYPMRFPGTAVLQ
jgi:DNA-binding LacI/PurR family transcriptional regulator